MDVIPMNTQTISGIDEPSFLRALGIQAIDQCEVAMAAMPRIECPVVHRFTPGLYIREILMPAGALISSKIHKTQHPYFITEGEVSVWSEGQVNRLQAPYTGITMPGTRRLLFCHTAVRWITCHVTDSKDVEEIERQIIESHQNPFMDIEYNNADGSLPVAAISQQGGEA